MKLEVNVNKKYAFMILGAILILAGAIYGYAYGGYNPVEMGHSVGEIEWGQQIPGAIMMDMNENYDVWIQGGASTSAGDERNLALLGHKNGDRLHINHAYEYDGNDGDTESVRIYGDTRVLGDLQIDDELCFGGDCRDSWPDPFSLLVSISLFKSEEYNAGTGIPANYALIPAAYNCESQRGLLAPLNSCDSGYTSYAVGMCKKPWGSGKGYPQYKIYANCYKLV